MVARLAGPSLRQRFREVPFWGAVAGLAGALGWLALTHRPAPVGPPRWERVRIAGFAPGATGDNGEDAYVAVTVRLPSGATQGFRVEPAAAAHCRVGQEIRLRIIPLKSGGETTSLSPDPCRDSLAT